jgi:hypothetical protein
MLEATRTVYRRHVPGNKGQVKKRGHRRQETAGGRQKRGDRRLQTGGRREETGDGSQDSGDR